MTKYYVHIDTFWNNSPDYFVGPFASEKDALTAAKIAIDDNKSNVTSSLTSSIASIADAIRVYGACTESHAIKQGMINNHSSMHNVISTMPRDTSDLQERLQYERYN
jgi:hypothetical protein